MTAANICKKYTSIYGLSNETYLDFFFIIITPSSSFLVCKALTKGTSLSPWSFVQTIGLILTITLNIFLSSKKFFSL